MMSGFYPANTFAIMTSSEHWICGLLTGRAAPGGHALPHYVFVIVSDPRIRETEWLSISSAAHDRPSEHLRRAGAYSLTSCSLRRHRASVDGHVNVVAGLRNGLDDAVAELGAGQP